MRIAGLQIERFGAWSGLKLEQLPKGLTLFYGPNEAGKTTLLQFLRSMFFGYRDEEICRYLQPVTAGSQVALAGARSGGSMTIVAGGSEYHLRRYASLTNTQDTVGEVRLSAQHGERVGSHRLLTLLSGVDETIFNNVFAVGLREIQQLATLDDTEAARQLYNLSTGTDRVSLVDIMRQLQDARRRLTGDGPQKDESYVGQLLARRNQCQQERRALMSERSRWIELQQQWAGLRARADQLEARRSALSRGARRIELAQQVGPVWQNRERHRASLQQLGPIRAVPPETIQQLDDWTQQRAELQRQQLAGEQQLETLQDQRTTLAEEIPSPRQVIRWEQLLERRTALQRLNERRHQLQERQATLEAQVQAEQDKLGLHPGRSQGPFQLIDSRKLYALLEPARNLERDRELLEQTKQDIARQRTELERAEADIATALRREPQLFDEADHADVVAAIQKTGDIAQRLRQQVECNQKLSSARQKWEQWRTKRTDVYRNQLLPKEIVLALGVVFCGGAFLGMLAFFGNGDGLSPAVRAGLGTCGGILLAVVSVLKVVLDRTAGSQLRTFQREEQRLAAEARRSQQRLQDLQRQMAAAGESSMQLEEAERRLERLESLLPLEARRRRARLAMERLEQTAVEIAQRMKPARQEWDQAVARAGVSSRLAPADLRDLIDDSGQLGQLQADLHAVAADLTEADREWDAWRERIAELALQPSPEGRDLLAALDQVVERLAAVAERRQRLIQLREDETRCQQRLRELGRELRQLDRRQAAVVAAAAAADAEELRARLQSYQQATKIQQQVDECESHIASCLGDVPLDEVEPLCRDLSPDDMTSRLQRTEVELADVDQQLKAALLRRGELSEQLRQLVADRRTTRLRLDENLLTQQLRDGIEQWRVVSTMSHLLKTVYKKYEKERQPDTLRDASHYLQRMSGGRYLRIWTPLADDVLLADAADGRTMPVQQLSSGTREQVYLGLRLALVTNYARRGIHMPVILDDVLVNFDVERTRAAAAVLLEFAQQGHQVLVFTCHQHVTEIFRQLNVEVRDLPQRVDASPRPAVRPQQRAPSRRRRRRRKPRWPKGNGVPVMLGFEQGDRRVA